MTNELVPNGTGLEATRRTAEQMQQLSQSANEAHAKVETAARHGLVCAYEAGQALWRAYELCPPGKWLAWLAANFDASRSTARRYMNFATECDRLGLNGSTLNQIPPNEASAVLKKLLVVPSGKKKTPKVRASRQPALSRSAPANLPAGPAAFAPPNPAATLAPRPATHAAADGPGADLFPRFLQLFQELTAGLEAVMHGGDCHDSPFAELLLMDLKTPFADLLDYLAERDDLKRLSAQP